jgi:hypothetical protein
MGVLSIVVLAQNDHRYATATASNWAPQTLTNYYANVYFIAHLFCCSLGTYWSVDISNVSEATGFRAGEI